MSDNNERLIFCENKSWSPDLQMNSDHSAYGSEGNKLTSVAKMKESHELPSDKTEKIPKSTIPTKGKETDDELQAAATIETSQGKGELADPHNIHALKEKKRRYRESALFTDLHALLPHVSPKTDKCTIVGEAMTYIKTLEETLEQLQKQKLERLRATITKSFSSSQPSAFTPKDAYTVDHPQEHGSSSNLLLGIINDTTNDNSYNSSSNMVSAATKNPPTFRTWNSSNVVLSICGNDAQISVCISGNKPRAFTTICSVLKTHNIDVVSAHVSSDRTRRLYMIQAHVKGASDQFPETSQVEEVYKHAASELMSWITS